mmetsp:Transcript_113909/g.317193  ORF Transcript_113909/g.317193 Transcript_113909/m.317193 type:complete len:95 (-) Transcript_113909:135-419(-)
MQCMLLVDRSKQHLLLFYFLEFCPPNIACGKSLLGGPQVKEHEVTLAEAGGAFIVGPVKEHIAVVQLTEDETPLAFPVPSPETSNELELFVRCL